MAPCTSTWHLAPGTWHGATIIGTGLCALLVAVSAFAQFNMPDAKEMSGIPRPVTDLPDAAISVRLIRGQLSNNIVNHPVDLHAGDKVLTVKTDDGGRALFQDITPGTRVRAVAVVDGERLESREFAVPANGGIRLMLVATAKDTGGGKALSTPAEVVPAQPGLVVLGSNTRIVVEVTDDGPQVFYLFDIQNTARAPVNPPNPFVVDLPSGATNATLLQGSSPQALVKDNQLIVNAPFPPGRTIAQVAFLLGAREHVTLSPTLPAQLEQLSVVVRKIRDVSVSARQLTSRQEASADGQTYIMASGPAVAAGTPITIDIGGLPSHSVVPRYVALGMSLAIVVAGLWGAAAPRERSAGAARRQQLHARREKLFADVLKIEQQRRAGAMSHDHYVARRETLIAQLERVYGELDQRSGVRGGNEGLAA